MQFHQVQDRPHAYIVGDDYGEQLGTVDEFHRKDGSVFYVATRFTGLDQGMFEHEVFPGFTAALQFVGR